MVNTNDAGKESRLEFIKATLKSKLNLEPLAIRSIAYEDEFPFPYNNFVYAVSFRPAASCGGTQPGTFPITPGTSECIIRLPNATSGYNNRVRVENEVAALALVREALQPKFPALVPRVFAWGSASIDQGWILQELMSGNPLLDDFDKMDDTSKAFILRQMAEILAALQRCKLPATVREFGGLQFGVSGEYVSAPLSIYDAGPFPSYADLVRATIETKLAKCDSDPRVEGWQANGIRARLDKFMSEKFTGLMASMGEWPKVLVHADLTPDNLLYDPQTKRLTALLDFDFAHIATYCDEFFRSLGSSVGQFPSARETGEASTLRKAMLHGFPTPLPEANDDVDWPSAKAWDDALSAAGAVKPSIIANIDQISDLFWLSGQILPFKLCNEIVVGNSTREQLEKWKAEGENILDEFLQDYGY